MDFHYARIIEKCVWTFSAETWSHLKQWCTKKYIVITVACNVDYDTCRKIAVMARRNTAVFHNHSSDSVVNQVLYRRTRAVLQRYQTQCSERHRLSFLRETSSMKTLLFSNGIWKFSLLSRASNLSLHSSLCRDELSSEHFKKSFTFVKVWDVTTYPMRRLSLLL